MKRGIHIAGGGLAGLSLGISLRRRGVSVRISEAGNYPRHRVCGEFISGVSGETLAALGIAGCFSVARSHESLVWLDCGETIHHGMLAAPALGISRWRLDNDLCREFLRLGGELEVSARLRPEPAEGFVWAAGRRARPGKWLGLKAHVRGLPLAADLEMHGGTNGYAGLAGIEDGWVNVCGLFRTDRKIAAKGQDLLAAYLEAGGNSRLATAVRGAEWRPGSFCAVAGFELGRQAKNDGLLRIGDAGWMIPPFTGNGMSMAFEAAEIAAGPLGQWAAGAVSWPAASREIERALRRKFRRRLAVAMLLNEVLLSARGRPLVRMISAARLLPFRPLMKLVR